MASLTAERTDATDEADQRRVAAADVLAAQLGHRQVEDRIPALLRQHEARRSTAARSASSPAPISSGQVQAPAGSQARRRGAAAAGVGLGLEGGALTLDGLGGVPHRRAGSAVQVHEGRSMRSALVTDPGSASRRQRTVIDLKRRRSCCASADPPDCGVDPDRGEQGERDFGRRAESGRPYTGRP